MKARHKWSEQRPQPVYELTGQLHNDGSWTSAYLAIGGILSVQALAPLDEEAREVIEAGLAADRLMSHGRLVETGRTSYFDLVSGNRRRV